MKVSKQCEFTANDHQCKAAATHKVKVRVPSYAYGQAADRTKDVIEQYKMCLLHSKIAVEENDPNNVNNPDRQYVLGAKSYRFRTV